jgi:hypothetical protein
VVGRSGSVRRIDVTRRVSILAGGLALAGLLGCAPGGPHPDILFRVRLTFHFKTPAGDRSYSGVWEAWQSKVSQFPNPGPGLVYTLIGEAIPMRFDNGRVVFALLVDYGGGEPRPAMGLFTWLAASALHDAYGPNYGDMHDLIQAGAVKPLALAPRDMPALVTFETLADPATGRFVLPTELAEIAGAGWAFDRAEIQVVQDRPTLGASQFLPWVGAPLTETEDLRWENLRQHPEYFVRKPPAW